MRRGPALISEISVLTTRDLFRRGGNCPCKPTQKGWSSEEGWEELKKAWALPCKGEVTSSRPTELYGGWLASIYTSPMFVMVTILEK